MPLISRPDNVADGVILPQHFNKLRWSENFYEPFDVAPRFSNQLGNGAATGATGDINELHTRINTFEWHVLGAGQTILVPVYDRVNGKGIDFGQDQTISEGHQLRFGPNIVTAGNDRARGFFKIGTDKAFYGKIKINTSDASGLGPFVFGLFKAQAYQTALTSYTDFAVFNCTVNTTFADIQIKTSVASVVTTVGTTRTWLDNESHTFEIRVTQAGVVTFILDGLVPTVTRSGFSFASGAFVQFGTFFLHAADLADNLWYQEAEGGFLGLRGDAGVRAA